MLFSYNMWVKTLEFINKTSLQICQLKIKHSLFQELWELNRDKVEKLQVDKFELILDDLKISTDEIEVLNKICPETIIITQPKLPFEILQACSTLNSLNLSFNSDTYFDSLWKLVFSRAQIMFIDSDINQEISFLCESASLKIHTNELNKIKLLKAKRKNGKETYFVFIPSQSIKILTIKRYSTTKNSFLLSEDYFTDNKSTGFIFRLNDLYKTVFYCKKNIDILLKSNKKILVKILRAKRAHLTIWSIDDLLNIKELFPDCAPHLIYSLNISSKCRTIKFEGKEWTDDLGLTEFTFSDIIIGHELSPEEFHFVKRLLNSRKTKFRVKNVKIQFNLLSECLLVLSLCADCPEIKTISLEYIESDLNDEVKTINLAIKGFREKFGFIQRVDILKKFCKNSDS